MSVCPYGKKWLNLNINFKIIIFFRSPPCTPSLYVSSPDYNFQIFIVASAILSLANMFPPNDNEAVLNKENYSLFFSLTFQQRFAMCIIKNALKLHKHRGTFELDAFLLCDVECTINMSSLEIMNVLIISTRREF